MREKPKNIDLRHADLVFLGCYFVSGLLDSSAYNAWSCFVSMQTGESCSLDHEFLTIVSSADRHLQATLSSWAWVRPASQREHHMAGSSRSSPSPSSSSAASSFLI